MSLVRWLLALSSIVVGCQSVPVTPLKPKIPENPPANVQPPIEKIDLLFMIDNSASMGTKQDLLALAVPDLVNRLLLPYCVLKSDATQTVPRQMDGTCPDIAREEFAAVHDLHLGVVSSSMGGGGATDICDPNAHVSAQEAPNCQNVSRHNDDRAHLVDRTKPDCTMANATEGTVSDALPASYLAWLPDVPKNQGQTPPGGVPALKDRQKLIEDFTQVVHGTQEFGCGLESQMESWYRFLVQPDPYASIELDTTQDPPAAQLVGVDSTILQQRHDFLRPDSLLAVIVVTDEEDSWSDPMWLGGRGWITRAQNNTYSTTGQLPRGTSACDAPVDPNNPTSTGPNDPACQWCAFKGTETDPNCAATKGGLYGPKEDGLNVRYTDDMKRRYGMTPQFPVQRYIDGLRSALVPDRRGEHFTPDDKFSSTYLGRKTCRNPIYASDLPTDPNGELCKLKPGPRTSDLVFYAVVGGVPWQLLTDNAGKPPNDPGYATAKFKAQLTDADWTRILGKDPATYQLEGIDPHMIESIQPRAGLPCQNGAPSTCDPFNGKDWDTTTSKVGIDLQYACTFPLPTPIDCTRLPGGATCDCGGSYTGPLCDPNPADGNNLTLQTRGKAYPTIRELRVAKALGENGVVASLCARTLDTNSAEYGYRPAMRAILDRLRSVLGGQCLSQPLARGPSGTVGCVVYEIMPGVAADQPQSCGPRGMPDARGLQQPDPQWLATFNAQRLTDLQNQAAQNGGTVSAADLPPVCELTQLVPDQGSCPTCTYVGGKASCELSGTPGWCYVEGAAAGQCPSGQAQALKFGTPALGETVVWCGP